jgi:predicted RNA methylase
VSLSHTTSPPTPLAKKELRDLSTGRVWRAIETFRRIGIRQLVTLMRDYGWRQCLVFVTRNIRHLVAHRLALRWDRRYGVDTAGSIQLDSLSIAGPNKNFGNECICTSPNSFDFIMRALPPDISEYSFVDIGAGKSRTLLLASRFNFRSIVGVEFAPELVACSQANIRRFKAAWQQCGDLAVVEADAAQFLFPETPLVLYFYNPFARQVFELVLANLGASLKSAPRACYLVYGSSSHNAIDWVRPAIRASGHFEELPMRPMPFYLDAIRTLQFAVFRAR